MRKKAENIISACVIAGFSIIFIGALVASFYKSFFILLMILGITILVAGLIYGKYNEAQERKLGIEAEEQKGKAKEIREQIDSVRRAPLPTLPKIARIYGALQIMLQISLILYGILHAKLGIHKSSLERIVMPPLYISMGMAYAVVGYLLMGGKLSGDAEEHKLLFAQYAHFAMILMLIFGYGSLFFGLCFASTLYRNNALVFKIITSMLILFGLFTIIYFNRKSVKIIFKKKLPVRWIGGFVE